MEDFSQFVANWSQIYVTYIQIILLIGLASAIAYIIIILNQNLISEHRLQKNISQGKAIYFITSESIPFFSTLLLLVSGSLLLSIIPAYIRWLLKIQPISVLYYPILTFMILFIVFRKYFLPILIKWRKPTFYIGNEYILLKQGGYYNLIPYPCIDYVKYDRKSRTIQFRYKRSAYGFLSIKRKFNIVFLKEELFIDTLHKFTNKNLFIVETELFFNTKGLSPSKYNQSNFFSPEIAHKIPIKLINIIENIWGLNEEAMIAKNIPRKKHIVLSFTIVFLFYFLLINWISIVKLGNYLTKIFSAKDLSYLLIFPIILSPHGNTFGLRQEYNQLFYTIMCFILAYFLSIRVFKVKYPLKVNFTYQISIKNISLYVFSFITIVYLFFTINAMYYFLMYNNAYPNIYTFYGNPFTQLSFNSTEMLSSLVIAPIFEELVFRGVFLQYLRSKSYDIVVILLIEFLIFPFVHIPNIIGSPMPYFLENLLIKGLFSVISTLLVLKTKTIKYSILFHSSWNTFVMIYPLFITFDNIKVVKEAISLAIMILSLIYLILIILNRRKITNNLKSLELNRTKIELIIQMVVFILILSQFFWVYGYYSSNLLLNSIYFTIKIFYTLLFLLVTVFVIYLFIKPNTTIYTMKY